MLYICEESDLLDDDFINSCKSLLSAQRLEKLNRIKSPGNRQASFAAYLSLRLALEEKYDINDAAVFDFADNGKPVLRDHPHIHFSLSHSENLAVCAVADVPVGVDAQKIKCIKDNVARRVLSDNEYDCFKSSDAPDEYFCELWTIKESYVKLTGHGIAVDFRKLPADDIKDKTVLRGKDYFCCVCKTEMHRRQDQSSEQNTKIKFIGRDDFERLCDR